ncbi:threonine/serine exporter family protein [Bacillus massiliigorillae]|uniref:threonine/serine exporter family protein n=1 Tax=Bacillus massiliigorillae TaxID=1243664 RepID=UPI00039BFF9A|nr:threonine/serine exporter family protein [Bacillus massiliigorillae]
MEHQKQKEVMEVCLLAGKMLLENGAETFRVEDTMLRMANAFGMTKCDSFVIPTGIIFSIHSDEQEKTKLVRVSNRTTDLLKITNVNKVSRSISEGKLTVSEAYEALQEIEANKVMFSIKTQLLAASISSGCFVIMFLGGWKDFIPAVIAGGLGFLGFLFFNWLVSVKFVSEFLASVIIGIVSYILVHIGFGQELDKIIIGSVMPLVPGLLITNAVRDLMAGHLVSGISKGADAFLTSFAIGGGIAIVLTLL